MKDIDCYNSKFLLGYSSLDKSSARLRISSYLLCQLSLSKSSNQTTKTSTAPKGSLMEMMQKNKAPSPASSTSSSPKIHSFVRLKLIYFEGEREISSIVLASIWPDDQKSLREGEAALDAIVFEGEDIPEVFKLSLWVKAKIEILEFLPYKPCSSIVYSLPDFSLQDKLPSSGLILSLPVKAPCSIRVELTKKKFIDIIVKKTNPDTYGMIELNTLLIKDTAVIERKEEISEVAIETRTPPGSSISYARTKIVEELYNRIVLPIIQKVSYSLLIKGVMMTGPPGVGKTFSLKALKHLTKDICDINITEISIPELLSESEPLDHLNRILTNKQKPICFHKPSINFYLMDEIDALGDSRSNNETQIAIKQRLIEWFKDENNISSSTIFSCLVSTSNHINDIDISLRRGGRFELEIILNSSSMDRFILLLKYLNDLHGSYSKKKIFDNIYETFESFFSSLSEKNIENVSKVLSQKTGGYVATDLSVLIREFQFQLLSKNSVNIIEDDYENLKLYEKIIKNTNFYQIFRDFSQKYNEFDENEIKEFFIVRVIESLMKIVPPSCLRGISINIPQNLTLNDVIGNETAKTELVKVVSSVCDLKMRKKLLDFRLIKSLNSYPSLGGILLYGLPGNSKTFLTKCLASYYNLPLLTLNCAQLFSMYVGESEKELRNIFVQARQAAPCLLFLDEIDTLVGTNNSGGSGGVESRVMSTLLNELDGVGSTSASANGVIIIGATNRIDTLDAALIRKGRFYKCIEVKSPEGEDQINLIKYFGKKFKLFNDSKEESVIEELKTKLFDGISGAQIESICKEFAISKLSSSLPGPLT